MKTINKSYSALIFTLLFFFIYGCAVKKNISSDAPIKEIEIAEIIKNSRKEEFKFEKLRNRVKVKFDNGRLTQNVNLNLRALEDEFLWISASMIVPIAKILMSNDRFIFYEKFQKTFIDQDLSKVLKLTGYQEPVKLLQDLLFGRPIVDMNKANWERINNSIYYVLQSSNRIQTTIFINPKTFKLDQQRIFIPILSSLVTVNYRNYKNIDGKTVPNEILISYIKGNRVIKINLEYSQFDFPENLNFPMEIPSDYKRVKLDELLK